MARGEEFITGGRDLGHGHDSAAKEEESDTFSNLQLSKNRLNEKSNEPPNMVFRRDSRGFNSDNGDHAMGEYDSFQLKQKKTNQEDHDMM